MIRLPRRLLHIAIAMLVCAVVALAAGTRAAPPPGESPGAAELLAGEGAGFGTTVPGLEPGTGQSLAGKVIVRIEVVTVGGRWASTPAIAGVKAGDYATTTAARKILREILASGSFARANVEAFPEGAGVLLRVNVLPRRLITAIKVNGGVLEQRETLDAAGIAADGELTAPQLADAGKRVERFYEAHGYPFAKVRADAADTDAPGRVIVSIDVVPGKPRTITKLTFVMAPKDDREVGNLRSGYKVDKGARVDEQAIGEADRDLAEYLKQHGFFRVEVRHTLKHDGDQSELRVEIKPGPRLVPAFDGNRAFDAGDLEAALNLEKSPDDRPAELTDRLRTFYVARGFLDAEVSMVEKGGPEDTVHYLAFTIRENQQVRVVKRVFPCLTGDLSPDDLGKEINSFLEEELPGAEIFSPPDPRHVVSTFGPTAGSGGRGAPADLDPYSTYVPDTYDRALKHLRDLYHAKGYLNAVIGPISVVRATCDKRSRSGECIPVVPKEPLRARCLVDSLEMPVAEPPMPEGYQCRPDPARRIECSPELTIRIPIALGPQMTLWDLAFDDNKSMPGAELAKAAKLVLGQPISNVELEAARIRVQDAYKNKGFAYAEVSANVEPSPDGTRARVRFVVKEREKVIVSGFVVKGAAHTNEGLILRRVKLKKGEPFQQDWARQTEERIATLGTFSSVSVGLEDAEVPARKKRVVITVVENQPQYIEARPGFSTGDGARLSFEWGHRNLGGLAISVALRIQLSYLFEFLILDKDVLANYYPSDADCQQMGNNKLCSALVRLERRNSLSFTFPEIGLGPLVALTLEAIDLRDNQRDYSINKEAVVPTVTYRPFPPRQLSVQLGVSGEYNDVGIFNEAAQNSTATVLRAPEGKSVAVAQRASITVDTRDAPLNATRGVLFSTSLEHVNAFPLGGNDAQGTNVKSHFLRFTGRFAAYIRLTEKGTTLAFSLGAGYNLQLFNGSKTYPDRLFFLGGVDSMRAFLADSMMPQDVAERILNREINARTGKPWQPEDVALRGGDASINPRAELRMPITDFWNVGFFFDTGNVWVDASKIDASLRYALGAGLRISTPVGPLAFDYGVNLIRRSWEDFGAFHFSIGLF